MSLSLEPPLLYRKDFILSTVLKYSNQKDFPHLWSSLVSLSLSIHDSKEKLHSEPKCHKVMLLAELLILGFLSVLSKFSESWWNPEVNIAL